MAAARKEGVVNLYSFGLTGDAGRAVATAFQQQYGIRVEVVTGVGTVLIERIRSEHAARKYLADTLDTSTVFIVGVVKDGLTQSMADLPVLREKVWRVPPQMDKEGHVVAYSYSYTTLYRNTNLVPPEEAPKSLKDLLQPKWKGKLAIGNPLNDPTMARWYVVLTRNKILGPEFFTQLAAQQPRIAPNVREVAAITMRGETPLGLSSATTTASLVQEGAPLQAILPTEGALNQLGPTATLLKNAPHPNAGKVFFNWMLSPQGQTIYNRAKGLLPMRTDVEDFTPPAARIELTRTILVDLEGEIETNRLMAEGTVAAIFGLKK